MPDDAAPPMTTAEVWKPTPPNQCTKENPWRPDWKGRTEHADAVPDGSQAGGWPGGDTQDYRCPNCGKLFTVELPQ